MAEKTRAEELALMQKEISISEFFAKNRHLLGFDSPKKALMMAVKEGVDNALDACQESNILPEVYVEVKQLKENKFRIVIEDNGPGIVKEQIPKIFGKLLYGSKFHRLRGTRGQQGLGVSAVLLYGQLTTGKGMHIQSKISPKHPSHYFEVQIDTKKNEPIIVEDKVIEWLNKDHGTRIEFELDGAYQKGRQSVDEYLKETALVNPHATINYKDPEGKLTTFPRAVNELPKESKEIKPHPYGVEIGVLIRMLHSTTSGTLSSFLQNDFCRVSQGVAQQICDASGLNPRARPSTIARDEAEKLYDAIQKTKIIAPPTDCLSPIGEEALVKGLKKEINAEFYTAVTRPPNVYRGNPFQIECCTGDSKIQLEDGTIIPIKDFVERGIINKRVFSMNDQLKIVPAKVLMVHKFKNKHKLLKITTRSGRSLTLTANNEIAVIEEGNIVWKKAEESMAGDFIAVPRIINAAGKIPPLLDLLDPYEVKIADSRCVISLMEKLKEKYGCDKQAAKTIGINYNTYKAYKRQKQCTRPSLYNIQMMVKDLDLKFSDVKEGIINIRIVDTKFTNPHTIKVPEICEDLLYILGLLDSDGYISRKNITFVNNDQSLHNSYCEKINSLFGLNVKRYRKKESSLCNKTLYLVLKKLEKIIPTLPNNLIIAWLKGIADGDGWVALDKGSLKNIGIATAKKEMAEFVQTLLLRIGILSKIEKQAATDCVGRIGNREVRTKKDKYNIIIGGLENIRLFHSLISFRQVKRSNRISDFIKNLSDITARSSRDTVPIGKKLCLLRKENGLVQRKLNFSEQTIKQIEHNRQNMSRQSLQHLLFYQELVGITAEQMKILAFSEILWDKIVDIVLVPNEEYVYDLTVETGNFLANNIVMHNCSIAYGGSLEKDGAIRLMRFANRVPLLYQQGVCSITEAAIDTNWRSYGLSQSKDSLPIGPVVLIVHMASVWVPFTSESKEAIANYEEIIKEVKLALQEVGRRLYAYIRKTVRAKEQQERINLFEKYIPELASSLSELSGYKKTELQECLEKTLKKGLKDLLAEVKEAESIEVEGEHIPENGSDNKTENAKIR